MKFGVVGVGYFGRHYVRLLSSMPGAELYAVSRVSSEYHDEVSHFLKASIKIYKKPAELFRDSAIDCVVIAAPTSAHFSLAKQALEAGKHVLVEKPMTSTLTEAEKLEVLVKKSGRIFMVGHQYLYNDYIRYLKSEIEKESLGKIRYILAEHLYLRPAEDDVGCFWETATHELAIIDYLFSPGKIKEVQGKMASFSDVGKSDFDGFKDDFAAVWIDFAGAPPAQITVSWMYPEKVRRFTVVGEGGSAVFDELRKEQLMFQTGFRRKETRFEAAAREPLRNELEHFIECVREGRTPLTGIEHGMRVTEYLNAVYQALNV